MTTAAEIRQQILDLQNRYNVGDIEVNEYNQKLEKLQLDLSNALQREKKKSLVDRCHEKSKI